MYSDTVFHEMLSKYNLDDFDLLFIVRLSSILLLLLDYNNYDRDGWPSPFLYCFNYICALHFCTDYMFVIFSNSAFGYQLNSCPVKDYTVHVVDVYRLSNSNL